MVVPAGQVVPPGDHVVPRNRTVDLCWKSLLQEFRRSGLTEAEFCRRISLHTFRKVSVRDFQLAAGGKLARVQMPWP
jgi:hypothetical protein